MPTKTSSGRRAVVTTPSDTQILIEREFDAPRHLVYKAWTTPELVKRWWSADMGATTLAEIDLRVGGKWRYVMLTKKGFEVAFNGEYREIVPNERIVFTEVFEGAPVNADDEAPVNTITFTQTGGRTTVRLLCQATTQALRDTILQSGMEAGMQKAWDQWEQVAIALE